MLNRLLVRNTIRKLGPIARYEVAKETGLTPPTVTVIVNELMASGIVREVGHAESSGGRRPVLLELNPTAAYIFAVRLQRGGMVTALFDLANNLLNQHCQALNTDLPDDVVEAIGNSFDWLLDNTRVNREDIIWCGVATPGLIDSHRGVVERSSNLNWEKVPLGAMVSKRLYGIPVYVENISNAAAWAEKEYGRGRGCRDLIYLNLSIGVGAGIIIDGEIYGGVKGYAGEIGHMTLVPEGGPRCACGRDGCMEAICGVGEILKRVQTEVPAEVFNHCRLPAAKLGIDDLLAPPLNTVPEVKEILLQTGRYVGIAVANLISLFNPEMVILGGELARAGDLLLETVVTEIRNRALKEIGETVRIFLSDMREDPPLMGAYALALEKVFAMENWG